MEEAAVDILNCCYAPKPCSGGELESEGQRRA